MDAGVAPVRVQESKYYELFRSELLPLLPARIDRVLDIGCGSGQLLKHIKGRGATFTAGFEYVQEVAAQAASSGIADAIHCINVETDELPYRAGHFDCIIASHVLEHLIDPWAALRKILDLLCDGGTFVGAIPNVRYFPVLRDLVLKGQFVYRSSGVLDRTHLRFFTRGSISSMLTDAGLTVEAMIPEIDGRKARILSRLSLGCLDDIACYAYNFRCVKKTNA